MEHQFYSRFIKGVISTSLGSFFTLVLGFLNIFIAIRLIPKDQFGTFLLLQTIVYSLVTISDFGLNIAATRQIACAENQNKSKAVNSAICFKLFVSILISLGILVAGRYIFRVFHTDVLYNYIVFIVILFCLESYNALFVAFLQGLHFYKKLALSQVILSCLNLVAMIWLLNVLNNGIFALILARLVSLSVALLYQMFAVSIRMKGIFDKEVLKGMIGFGLPLGLNNILTFIFMRMDTLMIGAYLNPIGVAYYGAASKIPDASRQMFESFRSVYFPNIAELFSHKKYDEAQTLLNNALRLITFITGMATLVVYLFKEQIVGLLFSREYLDCAPVLFLLMIALSMGLVGYILGTSLVAAGYSKLPVLINIVDTVVTVIANFVLIPAFGIMGAAYAAIIARGVTIPFNVYFLKRYGIYPNSLEYLKPLLILGLCIIIANYTTPSIFLNIMLISLYLIISARFSVITRMDMSNLLKGTRVNTQPST
ncbi:flippase [Geobacter sp. AOG1]|uniref:flippase n=1 Tax=Geobacter sp. AOG1 TaxID=1566346 RepID=UPI001CC50197|nr:flippase [Geobacter sp. AOG1]GFE58376.1 sugar translocase [Geobacter sp. AOG1]